MTDRNPTCTEPGCVVHPDKCCPCICETVCVTLTRYGDDPISTELDWDVDDEWFQGDLGGHDLLYYLFRDDNGCWLLLRSDSLGYPEGNEHRWNIPTEVTCTTLAADVDTDDGLLHVECVAKITPASCEGCRCLCECVCVTVTRTVEGVQQTCEGKLCWSESEQAYTGVAVCDDEDTTEYSVTVTLGPKGRYCSDTLAIGYDDCNPCDRTCVIVLNIPELGIVDEWQELVEPCEARNLDYSWSVPDPEDSYHTIDVFLRCAICHETCDTIRCGDCNLPKVLYATIENISNCECFDGLVIALNYIRLGNYWCGVQFNECPFPVPPYSHSMYVAVHYVCPTLSWSDQVLNFCNNDAAGCTGAGGAYTRMTLVSAECDPFEIVFESNGDSNQTCFGMGPQFFRLTLTV